MEDVKIRDCSCSLQLGQPEALFAKRFIPCDRRIAYSVGNSKGTLASVSFKKLRTSIGRHAEVRNIRWPRRCTNHNCNNVRKRRDRQTNGRQTVCLTLPAMNAATVKKILTMPAYCAWEAGLCNGQASVRPSVCLSHRSTAATAAGGFATHRRRQQQISIDSCGRHAADAGAQCGQRHVEIRRKRHSTDQLTRKPADEFKAIQKLCSLDRRE